MIFNSDYVGINISKTDCKSAFEVFVQGGMLESIANGGSFLEGFEDGALSGAISGAIGGAAFAGLGQLGAVAGKGIKCMSGFGKFIKGTASVTKVMSTAMGGFDTIALVDKAFGNGDIATLNSKLHESKAYNIFQTGVTAVAVLTNGMTSTMSCFVAGTLVMTAVGLVAIENIKVGDMVVSADPDTIEIHNKPVVDVFTREVDRLVHLTVNNEEIVTTFDHPFYVKGKGFINATNLWIGAELVNKDGCIIVVENIFKEYLKDRTAKVHNFKVEDFHTYFVGNNSVLVHNANYANRKPKQGVIKEIKNKDGSTTYTKKIGGKQVSVTYSKEGYPDFKPYAHPDYPNPVKINMTGNNASDFSQANNAIGLSGSKPPKGYTWHHMEDGKSMLLVRRDVHDCTLGGFAHTGGASIVKNK